MAKNSNNQQREFIERAIKVMNESIQEPRKDKVSPKVGAVLVKPNGSVDTAYRGELREGDHAEFTILERKNRAVALDGSVLYATLEPCAPGARNHPKLSCAERIVNARIKKVYVGIEDPDPKVDRKGINFLIKNNIEVEMFPADLQKQIRDANRQFIKEAEIRAKTAKSEEKETMLTSKEGIELKAHLDDLDQTQIENFIKRAELGLNYGDSKFIRVFEQLGLLEKLNDKSQPTGLGLLLFGIRPQLIYPNALIRATLKMEGRGEDIGTIEGSLVQQVDKIQSWYETRIGRQIDRSSAKRVTIFDYPIVVFREAIINAIVHRDYDIEGAPIYFEINDDAIIIKSPGEPVKPLKLEQMKQFNAPSLSRNPKIMYVFDQLGLVEQRGLGFSTIKELPEKFGIPLPIVEYEAPYMIFTFPRSSDALKRIDDTPGLAELNDEELKGLDWIRTQGEVNTREYSSHFNYGYKKAQRQLAKMRDLNLIEDNGEPTTSPKYGYVAKV
jgi:ATP-dependent DNA helicase RecG